jgi:uncharacterized protein (DUF362 family)
MVTRRRFLQALAGSLLVGAMISQRTSLPKAQKQISQVSLVKTQDRRYGVRTAVSLLKINNPFKDKEIVLKPNFNSAHPFPGSTHNDTLIALIELLKEHGAQKITVADRSGMGDTYQVMKSKGIFELAEKLGFDAIPINELSPEEWEYFSLEGSHWRRGVEMPKLFTRAQSLVQTCCLKTHRYGGHFTLSLKNSVGMVARYSVKDNYDYMMELHSSPYQREMIAEINLLYKPDLIVLDGLEAFVQGGPERGPLEKPGVMLAATDRVALDAIGVAILRLYKTTPEVARGKIFEHPQIKRAAELGLGARGPQEIEIVPAPDDESKSFAERVREVLDRG